MRALIIFVSVWIAVFAPEEFEDAAVLGALVIVFVCLEID